MDFIDNIINSVSEKQVSGEKMSENKNSEYLEDYLRYRMKYEGYYFLKPGEIFVSREPTLIHTVLGSCVSVCIFDRNNGVGGMNHFIFHHALMNLRSCRYGDVAVQHLIRLIMDTGGSENPANFTAHLVGGAQSLIPGSIVGNENIKIAKEVLNKYHIPIEVMDIGGTRFRKVIFNNLSGEIEIRKGESQYDW